jgi:hypothetical protein
MIKSVLLIPLLLFSITTIGQETDNSQNWMEMMKSKHSSTSKLKPENFIEIYQDCDFSDLLIPQTEFLGFISSDYRKIGIYFSSIIKDSLSAEYTVLGYSMVANNKCDFSGSIKVSAIKEREIVLQGRGEEYMEEGIKVRGVLIGEYTLSENEDQFHSGEFRGVITLSWYINTLGHLHYDKIDISSYDYSNNQYVGIWEDYSNGEQKTCNWGEYRILYCGDLDIGKTEFAPNPKYKDMGWFETNNNLQKTFDE